MNEADWPSSPFWDYSLALYGRPGVEAACLELQRRHGLDVNLVLLCCWLGARGVALDRSDADRLADLTRSWQVEVVRPLRAIRRHLKTALACPRAGSVHDRLPDLTGTLRARVLEVELDAEHIEQLALAGPVADLPARAEPGPALAASNLGYFWSFGDLDRAELSALLRAAFPEAGADAVSLTLSAIAGPRPREG